MDVTVLLATYNGERYIKEQLESLFAQTYNDFTLYITDDCSKDKTPEILKQFKARYPKKIILNFENKNSGSARFNFMKMINNIKDDYVFLSDQDDCWIFNKIETSLAKIKELENQYGQNTPLLVHTDLKVVDEDLQTIATSYREQVLHPNWEKFDFQQSMVMNIATGSTICYNRALAEVVDEMPFFFVMHDWWLLQVALAFGKVGHMFEQTVLYRQHNGNELGSSNVRSLKYKLERLFHNKAVKQRFFDSYQQAAAFLDIYEDKLSDENKQILKAYAYLPKLGKVSRLRVLFGMGAIKYGLSRKIATILFA